MGLQRHPPHDIAVNLSTAQTQTTTTPDTLSRAFPNPLAIIVASPERTNSIVPYHRLQSHITET